MPERNGTSLSHFSFRRRKNQRESLSGDPGAAPPLPTLVLGPPFPVSSSCSGSNSSERKLSGNLTPAWLPTQPSPPAAGQGGGLRRQAAGRPGAENTEKQARYAKTWKLQRQRDSGPGAGQGGPEPRAAHLHDTVISTLVAGMLPAKESNSLSDAMSSGCSIAHRPPHPTPN